MKKNISNVMSFSVLGVVVILVGFFLWNTQNDFSKEDTSYQNGPLKKEKSKDIPKNSENDSKELAENSEGMKKYTDKELSFSFEYPFDWNIEEKFGNVDGLDATQKAKKISVISPETEKLNKKNDSHPLNPPDSHDIEIVIHSSLSCIERGCSGMHKTLLEYLKNRLGEKSPDVSEVDFHGIKAYETNQIGGFGYYVIYLERDAKIFEIRLPLIEEKNKISSLQKNILSSFQFN